MRDFWLAYLLLMCLFLALLLGRLARDAWRRVMWPRRLRRELGDRS